MIRVVVVVTCAVLAACTPEAAEDRGTSASASGSTVLELDSTVVPAELQHLVPLAERWGIGDDLERIAKVDGATAAEREELRSALTPHHTAITAWLDSFGENPMSEEAAAFMYMQLALAEMPTGPSP